MQSALCCLLNISADELVDIERVCMAAVVTAVDAWAWWHRLCVYHRRRLHTSDPMKSSRRRRRVSKIRTKPLVESQKSSSKELSVHPFGSESRAKVIFMDAFKLKWYNRMCSPCVWLCVGECGWARALARIKTKTRIRKMGDKISNIYANWSECEWGNGHELD